MGLPDDWLEIAERVGVDTWLDIWEILDRDNISHPHTIRIPRRVRVPMHYQLIRYVRNNLIKQLDGAGHSVLEIQDFPKKTKTQPVTIQGLKKIIKKQRALDQNSI